MGFSFEQIKSYEGLKAGHRRVAEMRPAGYMADVETGIRLWAFLK